MSMPVENAVGSSDLEVFHDKIEAAFEQVIPRGAGAGGASMAEEQPTSEQSADGPPPDADGSTKVAPEAEPKDPNIGRRIGRFSVKSVIKSGGMGTVYVSVQDRPGDRSPSS